MSGNRLANCSQQEEHGWATGAYEHRSMDSLSSLDSQVEWDAPWGTFPPLGSWSHAEQPLQPLRTKPTVIVRLDADPGPWEGRCGV